MTVISDSIANNNGRGMVHGERVEHCDDRRLGFREIRKKAAGVCALEVPLHEAGLPMPGCADPTCGRDKRSKAAPY
ncbi:hypothetical protein HPB50_018374 [Hyalomma asiaticum]|uniref:Uncharacterized protein n=1 Tax=Hyalomma asiaticum TaxID=266040 RepID=A0ACB7TMI6_HYAAI|nr:hypothetical protein HPB50_018374 [Hyalomma asiaticum]